ncbi:MAG TPA: VCBS repeat-containing protein [Thermoanaerobaculia bacterium]|jgi:hypothetical protein|nr:VCBS repeat-containing protein [Thermoanaerobaculia bacterium]
MSLRKFVSCVLSATLLAVSPAPFAADAQEKPATQTTAAAAASAQEIPDGGMPRYIKPETPEERQLRLSTQVDPGIDPDPEEIFYRFGKRYMIVKHEKRWVRPTERPGFVKAPAINSVEEVYQENDKYVWTWIEVIDPIAPPTEEELRASQYTQLTPEQIDFLEGLRGEFTPLEPQKSDKKLAFEKSSSGLPVDGSWRNSLAVADMNGDGHVDIVLPPERAGRVTPSIFVGDGKGGWKYWRTTWPKRLNYGSVVAADFNKDKKTDLAFGIHLSGVAMYINEGDGKFREVERLVDYPTRRILAKDVDMDGWTDVVAISEGPVMRGKSPAPATYGYLRAYLNKNKGEKWEGFNIAQPGQRVSGDWLASGNFNDDKYPDFVGSSAYLNAIETIYLSKGANKYENLQGGNDIVPFRSLYYATTAGRFSARDRDDAIVTSTRRWVGNLDPKIVPTPPLPYVITVDRISFAGGQPKRTPIARWGGRDAVSVTGMNNGDFDGDGNLDLIYARADQRQFVLLLGDGKGGFRQATVDGLELGSQRHYDLTVADVNADKRPDVIIMYEAESGTSFSRKNGRVEVFLNRGMVKNQ